MADSTSAQQDTISSRAAAKQARAIFYKIETLVYEAIRTHISHEINHKIKRGIGPDIDLDTDIDLDIDREITAAITAHFAKNQPSDQASAPHKTHDFHYENNNENDETSAAHNAEFVAIRHLISSYVVEVIEQEAPAIITKTLAKALRMPPPNPPEKDK